MWIKSQDGKTLINTDLLNAISLKQCINKGGIQVFSVDVVGENANGSIGEFVTEERAISEMQNIEFALMDNKNFYEISEDK